jgi:hypothetical protein
MSTEHTDHARGARIEIAMAAATKGDIAVATGILAGLSKADRDEFGPMITALFPVSTPGRPFGAMSTAGRDAA